MISNTFFHIGAGVSPEAEAVLRLSVFGGVIAGLLFAIIDHLWHANQQNQAARQMVDDAQDLLAAHTEEA